jgi:epidermal growth factor receptor substrate 15
LTASLPFTDYGTIGLFFFQIRLPFGKRKGSKQDQAPPLPNASHLTPPVEEPNSATPAAEDDIDQVKQLCSMGFSRQQAVNALETHGYDFQRALNSLLQ